MGMDAIAGLALTVVITVAGWVWNLSGKIAKIEEVAATAEERVGEIDKELTEHREHVAAEYVSRGAMKEMTDAINRLGDRLDNLFIHLMPKP